MKTNRTLSRRRSCVSIVYDQVTFLRPANPSQSVRSVKSYTIPCSIPLVSKLNRSPMANSHSGHEGIFIAKHILPTVEVSVMSKTGIAHKCRAPLVSGSEMTYISGDCVQCLRLKRLKPEIIIKVNFPRKD